MNVTIKIDDDLCKNARHRAVDSGLSLSGWVANVISKELAHSQPTKAQTLLEALGNNDLSKADLTFARSKSVSRAVDFS